MGRWFVGSLVRWFANQQTGCALQNYLVRLMHLHALRKHRFVPRHTHHAVASSQSPDDGDGAGLAVRARIAGGGFMAYRNALQRTG
ncbi:hypothetical protein VDF71_05595 [Xanthomonas campestris pv. raphani]|uniref:hypothetical protein n=1 Tax=Xanthomonas campestris TaxID=339 RepID=UPI002B23D99D|nr:hypothetical protein [Xanthomonas campestris]MEA9770788.1 hypothetical protein [Xanthomonas campestris pv. raphani]MEA9799313.1 hypothetical protein [Xanthomonas campestris pv. raphani]MEA9948023.1 hypothetical protein [Xanthomonas campestris pv. raphani]